MDIETIEEIVKSMSLDELIEKSYGELHPRYLIMLDGKFYGVDWNSPALGQKREDVREEIVKRYVEIHKAYILELSSKPPEYFIKTDEEKEEIAICLESSTSLISAEERGRGKKKKVIETAIQVKANKPKRIMFCERRKTRTKYIPSLMLWTLRVFLPEKLKEVEKLLTTETEIYMEY